MVIQSCHLDKHKFRRRLKPVAAECASFLAYGPILIYEARESLNPLNYGPTSLKPFPMYSCPAYPGKPHCTCVEMNWLIKCHPGQVASSPPTTNKAIALRPGSLGQWRKTDSMRFPDFPRTSVTAYASAFRRMKHATPTNWNNGRRVHRTAT
jgi:hypothetical protein